jgi:hypothetical protein
MEGQYNCLLSSGTAVKIAKGSCVVWSLLDMLVKDDVLQLQ